MGKLLRNRGNKAQCMAQAKDVAIPTKSKFTFIFVLKRRKSNQIATMLQNNKADGEKLLPPNFAAIIVLWQRNY